MTQNSEPNDHLGASSRLAGLDELGALLRQARLTQGLELGDIAELTHVRRDYLKALEEGRYSDLPEDVYTRNFVRLFAQAVGVPGDQALEIYHRERQRAGGLTTIEERLDKERRGEPPTRQPRNKSGGGGFSMNPAIPTVLLVVVLVALAVWGYNALFFRTPRIATPTPPAATSVTPPAATPPAGGLAAPIGAAEQGNLPVGGTVLLDVITDPPGAQVSVDGFMLPGLTPIRAAPVTARAGRNLRVSLDGYETVEQTVDLSDDRTVELRLTTATASTSAAQATQAVAVGSSEIAITVRATSWLEVYSGTARNVGERLVYTTAAPGQTYRFALPVYIHAGNAAGVEITIGDAAPFAMGSAGAVVGRAFQAP